jgi:hypothetical protein
VSGVIPSVELEGRRASSTVASSTLPATVVEAAGTSCWTKAVVAICVVFVPAVAVGAVGVPVRPGEASGALEVSVGWTWSALAYFRDVPTVAVPSMTGDVAEA